MKIKSCNLDSNVLQIAPGI